MLKGLTIQELAAKIAGNQSLKRDMVSDTRSMHMTVREGVANEKPQIELAVEGAGSFPVLPLAHDQIGGRTGIAAKYYDRMRNVAPQLLATNVNHWFQASPERRMVRTLGGEARAFLSDRYRRVENEQIATATLPVLAELPNVQIVSSEATDRRLYIQAVVPGIVGEARVGDVVQAGVIIQNSEVGLGSVSVAAMIWRLRCLNGMKTPDAFRKNHVGRIADDGDQIVWSEDTERADDKALMLKVRDMVRIAVDETKFKARVEKTRALAESREIANPVKAVEVLASRVPSILEGDRGGILAALVKGGDLSAWGMLNAVTAQAHTAVSYDRAVEFEEMGGTLLELPATDWREILAAE